MLIRAYDAAERIIFATGQVASMRRLESVAPNLLRDQRVTFVHARSPTNNCYHFRIER